jgi:hypothetical protein
VITREFARLPDAVFAEVVRNPCDPHCVVFPGSILLSHTDD